MATFNAETATVKTRQTIAHAHAMTNELAPIMVFRAGTPLREAPASARRRLDEVLVC